MVASKMPRTIFIIKRLFLVLIFCLFLWLVFISIQAESETGKKYKLKHDYSNLYKNKEKEKIETPLGAKDKKAFMFRNSEEKVRNDLQPRLVYRGTDEEIDPNDIGLVRNADDKKILDDGYKKFAYNSLGKSLKKV